MSTRIGEKSREFRTFDLMIYIHPHDLLITLSEVLDKKEPGKKTHVLTITRSSLASTTEHHIIVSMDAGENRETAMVVARLWLETALKAGVELCSNKDSLASQCASKADALLTQEMIDTIIHALEGQPGGQIVVDTQELFPKKQKEPT